MPDYSQTKIYKLVCNKTGDQYYGHTTTSLSRRLVVHRSDAKKAHNRKCSSSAIIDSGDYDIFLIENYPCPCRSVALWREGWWQERNPCINKQIAGRAVGRDHQQYAREYYQYNKERLNLIAKKRYIAKREEILIQQKNRYDWNSTWDGGSGKGLNQISMDLFK